ncbi:MAG: CDP-2,3-bis-(O-geranylgeranyl)-sn-glycerol synthase [Promethearchaeota archaeon]|nr:MAG: CDP-2,3-bis-(O-geranylgeranyl)-sn-glycerol synthase [Candidatus Lokiarchaeota archaeon]
MTLEEKEIEDKHKMLTFALTIFFGGLLFINFLVITIFYSYSDWIAILVFSLLFIFPAYVSNAGMVLVGGGKPIDKGKYFRDGKRIFGDHKTWNGLIKGPLYVGIPISIGVALIFLIFWPLIADFQRGSAKEGLYVIYEDISYYQYYFIGGTFPIGFISLIVRIILCAYGAAIGDLIGSFLKRRFNLESGAPAPLIDQLDFAVFALLFTSIPAIIWPEYYWFPDINIIIFLIILTPSVSIIANTIAYLLGLKEVPW